MATQNDLIPGSGYNNIFIDSLIAGSGWSGKTISYSLRSGDGSMDETAFVGDSWSDNENAAFILAFSKFSAVCNLTFTQSANNTDANIGLWSVDDATITSLGGGESSLAFFFLPDGTFIDPLPGAFNWQEESWEYLNSGGNGFATIVHEIGHALGLAHPHDGGGEEDSTNFPGVLTQDDLGTGNLNQAIYTIMSYNDGWTGANGQVLPSPSYDYGNAFSPMAFDIAALQILYGANTKYNSGNNKYYLPKSNEIGTGWSCIWDTKGTDTISNEGSSLGCEINLTAATLNLADGDAAGGKVSFNHFIAGGFTIAKNVVIENAIGGSGDDRLIGNGFANNINGGSGNDYLDGGFGNDRLIGGLGDDIYYVDASKDVITEKTNEGVDTVFSTITYTLANNVENLTLSGFTEIHAVGNQTNNLVSGNDAANFVNGGLGNDTLTGGLGNDTFVFNTKLGPTNIDTITDFTSGDRIALAGSIFSKLKGVTDLSDNLYVQSIVGIPSRDDNVTNDYLFYDLESGRLYYDADGYGSGKDAVQIAIIGTGGISLTANDFSIV